MPRQERDSVLEIDKELEELRQTKAEFEALSKAALLIERRLEETEEQYRSVTETSIDAVITADDAGRIVTWNGGAAQMFGHGREIIGQPITTIIPESLRDAHTAGFARFLETKEKHIIGRRVELEGLRKDGTVFPIELSLSTWVTQRGRGFGAIIRDITERRRIERIREDVQRIVRHDLKSPLVGIGGFAGLLLKSDNLDEKQRKWLEMIRELSERMYGSINRSMDLFKMEQGTYELKSVPVNLIKVFDRLWQLFEAYAGKKSLSLSFFYLDRPIDPKKMSEIECIVSGDESLLEIAFENLIKNAIEASPENAEVTITFRHDDDSYMVDIHNYGVIPSEIRSRFFEPYVTCGKASGTGLGTHSARLVASTHRGDISFTTSESEGTHVIVRLPKAVENGDNSSCPIFVPPDR